ncbi:MAG: multicopper oxidase domain-containing protein [Candidatus Kapabacteria bacterium]|nr:multicopper oxidase domain-containing protein [Ignavibacteriota bacterium]MCW5885366.1 multicopper oxidase domain-containing protein [Candidatus Kapabacteria bacterium]
MNTRRKFIKNTSALTVGLIANNFLFNSKAYSKDNIDNKILGTENLFQNPPLFDTTNVMMIMNSTHEFVSGVNSNIISLGGGFPAPTIKVKKGDTLNVSFHNMLGENTNIHWHGIYAPENMDGHPSNFLKPNQAFTYEYQIIQRAGTYYYHSHNHMTTAKQVYNGMYGFLIIVDDEEKSLNLPSAEFEMLMAIQDIRLGTNDKLLYAPNALDKMEGWLGNITLLNGIMNTVKKVSKDSYRLRLVNASNARIYKLAFDDLRTFNIIGTDGGLLEKPFEVTSVFLGPAERLDIIVDFKGDSVGNSVKFISESYDPPVGHMGKPTYPQGIKLDIIRFDILDESKSSFTLPLKLSVIEKIPELNSVKTRNFELQMQMMSMKHTINNKFYDMDRIDETINFGDIEIWNFVNKDIDMMHPIHIHGLQFQILSRSSSPEIPEYEQGWKDTFLINGGETVRVIAKFNGYEGKYLLHCHNLEHEDDGMMHNYNVINSTSVENESKSAIEIYPNPAKDFVTITNIDQSNINDLKIFDFNGNIITKYKSSLNNGILTINLSDISSGNYFITLKNQLLKFSIVK